MLFRSQNRAVPRHALAVWAGMITCSLLLFAAQAAPAQAAAVGVNPDITWGIAPSEVDREVSLITQAHISWVRVSVDLSGAEYYGRGVLNPAYLSSIDYAVSAARSAGLNVLMEFDRAPYWASEDPGKYTDSSGMHWNQYYKYANPQDYASIVSDMVNRYKGAGVHAYEVWNEPNNQAFWPSGVNAAEYTALLRAAYPAIKGADPTATVVMGGLMNKGSSEYLQGMYDAGARGYYDVANFHIYPAGDPTQCGNKTSASGGLCALDALRAEMSANGDGAPVWITELGWSTCSQSYCVTPQQQASYITSAYKLLRAPAYSYVQQAFVYQMRDLYWETSNSSWESSLGVLNRDWTPKPAYAALKAAAEEATAPSFGSSTSPSPTVHLTTPSAGASIGQSVLVAATVSDPRNVRKVTFSVDGIVKARVKRAPYQARVSLRGLAPGRHKITATARDAAGRSATSTVIVERGVVVSLRVISPHAPARVHAARDARRLKAVGRVRGGAHGNVVLVLSRWAAGKWVQASARVVSLKRGGRYARTLTLRRGRWRIRATYGAAHSRVVSVRV